MRLFRSALVALVFLPGRATIIEGTSQKRLRDVVGDGGAR